MKRMIAFAAVSALCLLTGCGAKVTAEGIQTQYGRIATAEMAARVVCHLSGESRTYGLSCALDEKGAAVTVTEPEELAGIIAHVAAEGLTVEYEDVILSAGELEDICPANCLPYLLQALSEGYLLEQSVETLDDTECLRLALDTTARSGEKVLCTVWLDAGTLVPRYAEFSQNTEVVLTMEMETFQCTLMEE